MERRRRKRTAANGCPLERTLAQEGLTFELHAHVWGKLVTCRMVDGVVCFLGGPVSKRTPLIVKFRGKERLANRLIRHLRGRKNGFQQITVISADELVEAPAVFTQPLAQTAQPAGGLFLGID